MAQATITHTDMARVLCTCTIRTRQEMKAWVYVESRAANGRLGTRMLILVQLGFYMTLAAVPVFYVGYSLAYGPQDNFLARQYLKYKEGKKESEDADRLHQAVLSQAIMDRARLSSYPRETSGPDLNFPEYVSHEARPAINVLTDL